MRRSRRAAATSSRCSSERIPALRPLDETIESIHDQGGIAIAAHAMAPLTPSLGRGSLVHARSAADPRRRLDAIELMNLDRRPQPPPRGAA